MHTPTPRSNELKFAAAQESMLKLITNLRGHGASFFFSLLVWTGCDYVWFFLILNILNWSTLVSLQPWEKQHEQTRGSKGWELKVPKINIKKCGFVTDHSQVLPMNQGANFRTRDNSTIHRTNQFQQYTVSSNFARSQRQFEPLRQEVIPAKKL